MYRAERVVVPELGRALEHSAAEFDFCEPEPEQVGDRRHRMAPVNDATQELQAGCCGERLDRHDTDAQLGSVIHRAFHRACPDINYYRNLILCYCRAGSPGRIRMRVSKAQQAKNREQVVAAAAKLLRERGIEGI